MINTIKVDIAGIKPTDVNTLVHKYKNVKVNIKGGTHVFKLQIEKTFPEDYLLNILDDFMNNFNTQRSYELVPYWSFDETNSLVNGPQESFSLTHKEVLFMKILLTSNKIVTYETMTNILWDNDKNVSKNALRSFIKNIKKKLPENIVKNYPSKGYKLILD